MNSYLTNKHQRVKINNSYSLWKFVTCVVPQVSNLGSVLFNIFLCDLFFIIDHVDLASYGDDNTPYTYGKVSNKVLEKLECASRNIFEWFFNNAVKANSDRCHFLSSLDMNTKICVSSFDSEITHSLKLLGVAIDRKLDFYDHVSNLCKKASVKIMLPIYAFKSKETNNESHFNVAIW